MGYTFRCDRCGSQYDHAPPLMGEFRESFLKTVGGRLAEQFAIGQTVTVCADCSREVFL